MNSRTRSAIQIMQTPGYCSQLDSKRFSITQELADSKYQHEADNLLHQTLEHTGKKPRNFITDGLPAYAKSSRRVFGKST